MKRPSSMLSRFSLLTMTSRVGWPLKSEWIAASKRSGLACLPARFLNLIRARRGIPPDSFFSGSALMAQLYLRASKTQPFRTIDNDREQMSKDESVFDGFGENAKRILAISIEM